MTEDKAAQALKKVIINLTPSEYMHTVVPNDAVISIDVSDRLDPEKFYFLDNIEVTRPGSGGHETIKTYIPYEGYNLFKEKVEDILDAAIVNAKQRESLQKLLNGAFYDSRNIEDVI